MVKFGSSPPPSNGGMSTQDFYTASKSSVYPTYSGGGAQPRVSGQSKYATPELEAAARPFADIGKINLSLLPTTPGPPLPGQPDTTPPPLPGAAQIMREGMGLNLPGQDILGGGIDFLSHIAALGQSDKPGAVAQGFFDRLKNTPDEQLSQVERQTKSLNQGLFAQSPDSPIMQGKQVSEMYKAFLIAKAHSEGQSSIIQAEAGLGEMPDSPIGAALMGYGLLAGLFRRAIGGGAVDQLQVLKDTPDDQLGEERLAIKQQWQAGKLNDAEARDSIAMSSFALTNPNPVKVDDHFGPVDTVANAAIAVLGEFVSDPLSIPATVATVGTYAAAKPIETTLASITRSIGRAAIEGEAKTLGKTAAEHALGSGSAAYEAAIARVTGEAEQAAARKVGEQALLRRLPKEATAAAKAGEAVGSEAITQSDRLAALLDMGADPAHPYAAAVKEGVQAAGLAGQIATKAPSVVRLGTAIDKLVDPFSLFGYWRTGKTVPAILSREAAHGYLDAIGWRVARNLDNTYAEAGVSQDIAERSRAIAAANHTVQVGDRSNTARAVNTNSALMGPETPTEQALRHASRRPGDIRSLVRDQVDRTMEFIVPATKGGKAQAMAEWRARAAKQLTEMGADPDRARAVASKMDERGMRALANDHWGRIIDTLDEAKRGASATAKWDLQGIGRMTVLGPRQMADQDAEVLAKAIADGDANTVRQFVRRFRDLNQNISESLPDTELLAATKHVLGQIQDSLPTKIDDLTDLPPGLTNWLADHPGYNLMLRPADDRLAVPVRDAAGNVTGMNTWIDHITDRVPTVEVTGFKSIREGLLRNVAGGELERNAGRRFATTMAQEQGLSEAESASVLRSLRETADIAGTTARGLSSDQIIDAVDRAVGLSPTRKMLAKRTVQDALFDAYENEMRLVGVLPKLTGWTKTQASAVGGNTLGWITDNLYPKFRFTKNPLFFTQEVPEAAFFLALAGRYPISSVVPDVAVRALEAVPGPTRALGERIGESKAARRIWDDKTLVVMDRMTRVATNAENDSYEAAELVRMGLTLAGHLTDPRTPLGKMLQKVGGTALSVRKQRSVALALRREYGETWKRALLADAPEQWNAVRAFYPADMSDSEVGIQWLLDNMARADPDGIFSALGPGSFRPTHIGARAEVSDELLRHFAYGPDAKTKTWDDLVREVNDKTVSIDSLRNDMLAAGADPNYVERAVTRLTFGTPDEFYRAAVENGISQDTVDAWRASNRLAAGLQGISEGEYLARNYVGRPLATDQMGNVIGDTLFDDIVESMKARGKAIPDSNSQDVQDLKDAANGFISGVLRPVDETGAEMVPVPAKMPRGTPKSVSKAASKVRSWEKARAEREADPTLGAPPQVADQPLYQSAHHTIGVTNPVQYQRQIEAMMDPEYMAARGMRAMTEKDVKLAIEWYDHMQRATFALVDDNLTGAERIQEAARILVAFGTTQLNTSPADGYRHVFKAYGMKARGETLQLGEARNIVQQAVGLNPEQLDNLIWGRGNKIDQMGIAQKLFDFIDSLTGSKTRTNGILGPKGDWGPVAVDIHTKRDFGFLDPAMGSWVYRLVEKGDAHGVSSRFVKEGGAPGAEYGHFVVDMSDGTTEVIPRESIGSGVPTDHEYDYGVELGNDIRDHFNQVGFMGREWSSYEVQAIGWYRMQMLKSTEGDAGEVANAVFEQSRWMGSHDLVPSVNAPMNEVHPWDALHPDYHRAIVADGARHASDEAEMATGARAITKTDSDAVVNGQLRPATTVELATDPTGAEQYLAHYLLYSEQDGGVLMRDYVGTAKTPRYDKGVGISVDIPVESEEQAQQVMADLAGEPGRGLQVIGPHTFVARAADGSLHLRTLWQPDLATGKGDRNAFKRAVKEANLDALTSEHGVSHHDTLVDFVALSHDWKADPSGSTYTNVINRGSGKHGVMRTPAQREALVAEYDAAYQRALASGDAKAIRLAKKEMEVARAAPAGLATPELQQLVGAARVRVRTGVTANFDKYASREVRNERERVLGEARDAAAGTLGTDPSWGDVLGLATGSNGERLYDRSPGGTVRAAITRADSDHRRGQLYFSRRSANDRSLIHELVHKDAWQYDDSANRTIAGVHAGLEGTPYGTWTPGTPLTEAQHEWLVSQYFLWAQNEDSVHPTMAPLLKHLHGQLGSQAALKSQATAPSRAVMKQIDLDLVALNTRRASLKSPSAIRRVDAEIVQKMAQRDEAVQAAKALRAQGGLHPDVKSLFDNLAAQAGQRSETRASTYNADEQNMLEWAQIAMSSSQRRANDLVHMRGERSALERSINHPFLGIYPSSYTYGKVLPYMTEFLMARPFGMKAPFLALTMGQHMNQSFSRQQQYDPELRNFLYKNEPFLRALSIFVPGVPWDLPANAPIWQRRIIENWLTNAVRKMHGQKEKAVDIPAIIADSAMYQLTLRGTDSWAPIIEGAQQAPAIGGAMMTGQTPPVQVPQPQQP